MGFLRAELTAGRMLTVLMSGLISLATVSPVRQRVRAALPRHTCSCHCRTRPAGYADAGTVADSLGIVVGSPDVGKVRVLDGLIRPAKDFLARIDFLAESCSDIGVMGVQPTKAESALVHRRDVMDRDRHDFSSLFRGNS